KLIEVDDEQKFHTFYEKLTATEVAAEALDEEWKGYVVPVSAGNNKQGFPMKHGVLTHGRVCLLLSKGHFCYRPRRTGVESANLMGLHVCRKKAPKQRRQGTEDQSTRDSLSCYSACSAAQTLVCCSKETMY
ncbi:hypothetical protein Celaphus_00013025, partial [Cervus elaphus hippelaphus]